MPRFSGFALRGESDHRRIAWLYGLACHILFTFGVGAMIYEMFFGMSRSWGPFRPPFSFIVNGLLIVQFPVLHSLLLTRIGGRVLGRLAPRAVGSTLTTTTYATVAGAQVALLFLAWSPMGAIWWSAAGWLKVGIVTIYASSWLLLLKAIVDAGFSQQIGLLGWWAAARNVPVRYPPMPRSGLFRICRQPIYLAFTLTVWSVPTWTPDQLVIALGLTLYCLIGPLFKEARFSRRFKDEFARYRETVPYWLPEIGRLRPRRAAKGASLNDQSVYDIHASKWWTGKTRWLRTLHNLVPARLHVFDKVVRTWLGRDVLDLGCGGGFLAEELARRGANVTGVDPSQPAIDIARDHAGANFLKINYQVGTGERIPFANDSFDIVVCVDVLEHVEDLPRVIMEVRRVVRPGGLFLFDTINRTFLAKFMIIVLGERVFRILPPGTHDSALFIKPAELRTLLAASDFESPRMNGFGPRSIDAKLDLRFGGYPTNAVMYLGHARLRKQAGLVHSPELSVTDGPAQRRLLGSCDSNRRV